MKTMIWKNCARASMIKMVTGDMKKRFTRRRQESSLLAERSLFVTRPLSCWPFIVSISSSLSHSARSDIAFCRLAKRVSYVSV